MIDLIIGDTSQQSFYYPDNFIRISSRNIDFKFLDENRFGTVVIAFAEQRIYDPSVDYIKINYTLTLDIIERIINRTDRIIVFTTCELWGRSSGVIYNETPLDFDVSNEYSISKASLFNAIKRLRKTKEEYNKIVIIHPFYFNSIRRSQYFLFGKIFDSILNKKNIEVGNLNFYRDMIHTSFLVKKCLESRGDQVLGSGKLFNVREFVIDLYQEVGLDYFKYVKEDITKKPNDKLIRAGVDWEYTYQDLLSETIKDIEEYDRKNY